MGRFMKKPRAIPNLRYLEGSDDMEQFFMGLIVFLIVAVVRRKEVSTFRWQPTHDTWAAVGVGALAFALSASLSAVS